MDGDRLAVLDRLGAVSELCDLVNKFAHRSVLWFPGLRDFRVSIFNSMEKTMRKIILTLAAVLAFTTAHADESHVLSYNYISAIYGETEADIDEAGLDGELESDGYGIEFSVDLGQNLYIFGGYAKQEIDGEAEDSEFIYTVRGVDADTGTLGLGYYRALSDTAHWNLGVSAIHQDIDGLDSEWGAQVSTGFRVALGAFEVRPNVGYMHFFDDDIDGTLTAGLGAELKLGRVALNAGYSWAEETDSETITGGVRVYF